MKSGKIRNGIGAGDIAAAVLMTVGGIFLLITLILEWNRNHITVSGTGDVGTIISVFGMIGGGIFLGGIAFAAFSLRRRRIMKQVVDSGCFVTAEVVNIRQNFSTQISGISPYVLECHYQDPPAGILHVFSSRNLFFYPAELLGSQVRVYIDPDNMSHYYVDVENAASNVQLH